MPEVSELFTEPLNKLDQRPLDQVEEGMQKPSGDIDYISHVQYTSIEY